MCDHDDQEMQNEIAVQRQHENRCTACNGTGIVKLKVSVPFSSGEISEEYEEKCPICGDKKNIEYKKYQAPDYNGYTNQEISNELEKIRKQMIKGEYAPHDNEILKQAEKRLTRKD